MKRLSAIVIAQALLVFSLAGFDAGAQDEVPPVPSGEDAAEEGPQGHRQEEEATQEGPQAAQEEAEEEEARQEAQEEGRLGGSLRRLARSPSSSARPR